ncbi:hypothetical protein BATDEDRAFT_90587 [Batrachochytrium dendrobatidis JAM81]|uniref:Uncharacterized protein n=1 Tax=Batrachochytrium dendrobatidis (strain JAM81 / FGSC 10211) TaxID=684364 RepID=F4P7Y3_BATDJ|nr:uncharacterized protein BATDEDRAFT_90587 [Batrachochytrium dendrobatidis JAM81]EGF78654.1 hypothetical protein BATDEDRAFT_90587 [Batrachochytrium dendrobatidis JAM81]|eukprot:XP_006680930.1 hypothetical protein BATDEDRAFT_90587 [Batrachochytrium dendrobatidis JAM81]
MIFSVVSTVLITMIATALNVVSLPLTGNSSLIPESDGIIGNSLEKRQAPVDDKPVWDPNGQTPPPAGSTGESSGPPISSPPPSDVGQDNQDPHNGGAQADVSGPVSLHDDGDQHRPTPPPRVRRPEWDNPPRRPQWDEPPRRPQWDEPPRRPEWPGPSEWNNPPRQPAPPGWPAPPQWGGPPEQSQWPIPPQWDDPPRRPPARRPQFQDDGDSQGGSGTPKHSKAALPDDDDDNDDDDSQDNDQDSRHSNHNHSRRSRSSNQDE